MRAELRRFEATEPHMGTLFTIKLYASDDAAAQAAFRAAFARIKEMDDALSDYNPNSELMAVCRQACRNPVRVSPTLFHVLEASQLLAKQTGGAFDVTLGPLIRLWRQARKNGQLPAPQDLERAAQLCGYRKLVLDSGRSTVFLQSADMQLDLGAIAKGYAADEALKLLRERGVYSALVAASGDLAIGDAPPGEQGWRVGIGSPDPSREFTTVLVLANTAISTSGDTEQYAEIGGVHYSHIVDPKTRMGITDRISVTVLAKKGINADSLATALSVLTAQNGIASALSFIERCTDAAAMIVRKEGQDYKITQSSRFTSDTRPRPSPH
jgi:thiamine biosynthesis lipoprotein